MSHKTKKDEKKRQDRGPTFVGLRPIIEAGEKERIEKRQKKHKKDLTKFGDYDNI